VFSFFFKVIINGSEQHKLTHCQKWQVNEIVKNFLCEWGGLPCHLFGNESIYVCSLRYYNLKKMKTQLNSGVTKIIDKTFLVLNVLFILLLINNSPVDSQQV